MVLEILLIEFDFIFIVNSFIICRFNEKSFPYYKQLNTMDCVSICLRIMDKYFGRNYSL